MRVRVVQFLLWAYRKLNHGVYPPPQGDYVMVQAALDIEPNKALYVYDGTAFTGAPNLCNAVGVRFITNGNYGLVYLVKGISR